MPILLVFIQYKNVDVVGSGVAKQSSSISWALLYCKYKNLWLTLRDTRLIIIFWCFINCKKDVVFLSNIAIFPMSVGKYQMFWGEAF